MSATRCAQSNITGSVLYLAFELGLSNWELAFTVGPGQKARRRIIKGCSLGDLTEEIVRAKKRFGLAADTRVLSCYEAGRDGFWLHRFLVHNGIENLVVDSSSIEVKRRARRAKSDRLDVEKLLSMLIRYDQGESKVWSVVNAPSVEEEDGRQLHREMITLKGERTRYTNRIKGLLAGFGLTVTIDKKFPSRVSELRQWDGSALPSGLHSRLLREFQRLQLSNQQIAELERERLEQIRNVDDESVDQVRHLLGLRGIGVNSAWLYSKEIFGWRKIRNRRELGSLVGLTPTPYQSGESNRELGISKAGNRWMRSMTIEIAWRWLQFQPHSSLSQWYQERFGSGNKRLRKIGIVALARKLLIALWKYIEQGEIPEGAELSDWRPKVKVRAVPL